MLLNPARGNDYCFSHSFNYVKATIANMFTPAKCLMMCVMCYVTNVTVAGERSRFLHNNTIELHATHRIYHQSYIVKIIIEN